MENKPQTWEDHKNLQSRNQIRIDEFKKQMGKKWLLHPDNFVKSKKVILNPVAELQQSLNF